MQKPVTPACEVQVELVQVGAAQGVAVLFDPLG
jgi:hypothetical protein